MAASMFRRQSKRLGFVVGWRYRMKIIKRFLAGIIAGLAIQPAARAATVGRSIQLAEEDLSKLGVTVEDCGATSHAYLHKQYAGPRMAVDEHFQWAGKVTNRKGNWQNNTISREAANRELDAFIQARTK
jgi:hypothetical protein